MSTTSLFNADAKSAYIRDNALILYFQAAETPLVSRFDLDSLVQANFEVVKKDEVHALVLRDFAGQRQEITTFANKADAHQALYAILQALLSYGEDKKTAASKGGGVWKFFKYLFLSLIVLAAVAFVLVWLATPVSHVASLESTAKPAASASPQDTAHVPAQAPAEVPEGQPMNMDEFVAPAASAPVEAPQTGMTPAPADEKPAMDQPADQSDEKADQ